MMYVYARLTRTGLCNKLFPWARAVVYAHETGARIIAPRWVNLMRIGPWIRRERDKRYYINEFTNDGYCSNWFGIRPALCGATVFAGMESYFAPFLTQQPIVKAELRRIVNPKLVAAADEVGSERFIGVHVRRGDFVSGGISISDAWYIRAISVAREVAGDLPVKIFSDGNLEKLKGITSKVKNSVVMAAAPAVHDLLALSHSQVLVATSRSTFSMWAVFLGQMTSIWCDGKNVPTLYVDNKKPLICEEGSNEAF